MSQIQTGRYSDLLRRYLGMKGVTTVAAELSPEISPAFILESERPEWWFLKNEKLASAVFAVSASVGNPSSARLQNPATSGVMAIVTLIDAGVLQSGIILIERNTDQGSLATILPTIARDTRLPILNASALISSVANVGTSGEAFWSRTLTAQFSAQFTQGFVLTPGNQIQVSTIADNIAIRGSFQWLERRIDEMEEDV